MRYPVILADPPVPFECWGSRPGGTDSRSADAHYKTMTWSALFSLRKQIESVSADDCVLFLWLCQPLLRETVVMARKWGFQYKTKAFSWVKLTRRGDGFHVGMGYWTRANTEDVLLFTRGEPHRKSKKVSQMIATLLERPYDVPTILAPIGKHSEKPEAIQDEIENLVDGPYLELFARRRRPGWACIGNELDGLDIRDSLSRIANDERLPMVIPQAQQTGLWAD